MEADIQGHQRKVVRSRVRPARRGQVDDGIPVREGATEPFVVERAWNAPAGRYIERWYVVEPNTREVFYEGPERDLLVWGLQSLTEIVDEVRLPIPLEPGSYQIVFSLGGVQGGQLDVATVDSPVVAA